MKFIQEYKLFEVVYTDRYPDSFVKFRKKWNKPQFKTGYNYWVQFTNYKGDYLDRSMHISPDHSDPVGNYAYPLRYVTDYPMDIWYGANMKRLRVLKRKTYNTLNLNIISNYDTCVNLLYDIFKKSNNDIRSYEIKDMMDEAIEKHSSRIGKSINKWAKVFFQCIQYDYKQDKIRSGEEQSNLLIKAGYDSVMELSRTIQSAIINDREPEQIIFLLPTAFEVVDIIELSDRRDSNKNTITKSYEDVLGRKWAAQIFNLLDGDKIKEKGKSSDEHYFSVKGREIWISFQHKDDSYMQGLKLGQKHFKKHKLHDDYIVVFKIITEFGNISFKQLDDEPFSESLEYIGQRWNEIKHNDIIPNWIPRSKKQEELEEEARRNEYYEKERIKKREEFDKRYPEWKSQMEFWSEYTNIPFTFYDDNTMYKYYQMWEGFGNRYPSIKKERIDGVIEDKMETFITGKGATQSSKVWYGADTPEKLENVKNFILIMKQIYIEADNKSSFFYYTFYNKNKDKL